MPVRPSALITLPALLLTFALVGCGTTTPATPEYKPSIAQEGKDVIWIPTPTDLAERMLKIANVTQNDLVYDLGAGDGKIAILAAKQFKATAIGIEFNPDMAEFARKNAQRAGVSDKVTIITGDIFKEDFSKATVVTLYLLPALNIKLRPTILAMKPGTRIVSNTFTMGSWIADETVQSDSGHMGYLWIVPAKVEGQWSLKGLPDFGNAESTLSVKQHFQRFDARLRANSGEIQPTSGKLVADTMSFEYVDRTGKLRTVVAKIEGDRLKGTVSGHPGVVLSGTRTP
jgi:SAM-dependent methyltransferase